MNKKYIYYLVLPLISIFMLIGQAQAQEQGYKGYESYDAWLNHHLDSMKAAYDRYYDSLVEARTKQKKQGVERSMVKAPTALGVEREESMAILSPTGGLEEETASTSSVVGRIPVKQREALIALYNSTKADGNPEDGEGWIKKDGWKDGVGKLLEDGFTDDESLWYGVKLDENNDVIGIYLSGNNLKGELPEEFIYLDHLRIINLNQGDESWWVSTYPEKMGYIGGTFFDKIANPNIIEQLNLKCNDFSDNDISILCEFENLKDYSLHRNRFSGFLPDCAIGGDGYIFHQNFFTGKIPSSWLTEKQKPILVFNNLLSEIDVPSFDDSYTSEIKANKNQFTWSDLIPVIDYYLGDEESLMYLKYGIHSYFPQGEVDEAIEYEASENETIELTTNIDRNTDPPCKYQWFKFVEGGDDIPVQSEPQYDAHTWTLTVTPETEGYYYYRIFNEFTNDINIYNHDHSVWSKKQHVKLKSCAPMLGGIAYDQSKCALGFWPMMNSGSENCEALSYSWDFGDGTTSDIVAPVHVFKAEGTYEVSLTMAYQCSEACGIQSQTVTKEVVFKEGPISFTEGPTDIPGVAAGEVLQVSVTSYGNVWPLETHDKTVLDKHPYANGMQGVWRPRGSYVFDAPRDQSPSINIKEDGAYTYNQFQYGLEPIGVAEGWIKANEITRYSSFGYEIENKDVLGHYSSAVYDYYGQLPVAVGANMKQEEMAFSSFEHTSGHGNGNWQLGNEGYSELVPYYIEHGERNYVLVDAPIGKLEDKEIYLVEGEIKFALSNILANFGFGGFFRNVFAIEKVSYPHPEVLCLARYDGDPEKTIVEFTHNIVDNVWLKDYVYKGKLYIKEEEAAVPYPPIQSVAHTGKRSMNINQEQAYTQKLIKLEGGKEYLLSAWASIDQPNSTNPVLPDGISISLGFYNGDKQKLGSADIGLQGYKIEGWQKLEGTFTAPEGVSYFDIAFHPGSSGQFWLDDLKLHPKDGEMTTYVYDIGNYRLTAQLDGEHYATYYYYDEEGNLYLLKKETERGIKTLQESVGYQVNTAEGLHD